MTPSILPLILPTLTSGIFKIVANYTRATTIMLTTGFSYALVSSGVTLHSIIFYRMSCMKGGHGKLLETLRFYLFVCLFVLFVCLFLV